MRTYKRHQPAIRAAIGLVLACGLSYALACALPSSSSDEESPLAGLTEAAVVGADGRGIPQPTSPHGAGHVRGTLIGPSLPGAGDDSLETAPRIAGATIRIYPVIVGHSEGNELIVGEEVASITTDANGQFETPVFEGGTEYVLTFLPPAGTGYAPVWARTIFWTTSHEWPWWVTAPRISELRDPGAP